MTEEQIKHMVDRFLSWKLPENFNPDGGISFERIANVATSWERVREPVGTNLLDATQADAMVRHMLEGLPPTDADQSSIARIVSARMAPAGEGVVGDGPMSFFSENVDRWGAAEWFDRLAKAIRDQDKAVVAGDDIGFETYRMIAASSAMTLVREHEATVRAALSTATPPVSAREGVETPWQPIDTAPKNGMKIDMGVLSRYGFERFTGIWWSDKRKSWVRWDDNGFERDGEVKLSFAPTHWMPIPEAPQQEAIATEGSADV